MLSSKKETKKINFFKKLFTSPKPKRRVIFFVLLAILVLGVNYAHATVTSGITSGILSAIIPGPGGALAGALTGSGGQKFADALGSGLAGVLCGVLYVIATVCKYLVLFSAGLIDLLLNPLNPNIYNFTSNPLVVKGWTTVRDVCNLFFLLVLLFIALCTILKIEKYHAKKTLLTLIIMALLINFSKPIAIFIFDGSQLLMNEFLRQMGGGQLGQSPTVMFTQASNITDLVYGKFVGYWASSGSGLMIAVQYMFIIIFLFMYAIALLVTALMLIIRIVAVMVLIIVSPLAFFAAIVPDFSKMSSQWWSALFEYSYYGPAAAFFLLLATKLSTTLNTMFTSAGNNASKDMNSAMVTSIIQYLVVLVFLYASIIMAKKLGGGVGTAIVSNANRAMKYVGRGTYKVPRWASYSSGVTGATSQKLQQSAWTRWMTKAGRKKNVADREARLAARLGVEGAWFNDFQKRAKEENEGLDNNAVIKKARTGDPRAALQAVMNGDGDDLQVFGTVMDTINKHPEMREHFRHLYRKAGQTQFAAQIQALTPRDSDREKIISQVQRDNPALSGDALEKQVKLETYKYYAEKELGRLGKADLAKLDFNDFANNKNHVSDENVRNKFKEALLDRFTSLSSVNASNFVDMMSDAKGANQEFFRKNPNDFGELLKAAQDAARTNPGSGQTPSTPPPNWTNAPWS